MERIIENTPIITERRGGRFMPAQLLLNLFIAFLWMLLIDEDELKFRLFCGLSCGDWNYLSHASLFWYAILFATCYMRRIKLLFIFISELTQSSVLVLKQILSPKLKIQPGIFKYETVLKSDLEITMISLLLTLDARFCRHGSFS